MDQQEMARRIKKIEEEIAELKEDFELSQEAKDALQAARKTPRSEYVDLV